MKDKRSKPVAGKEILTPMKRLFDGCQIAGSPSLKI